MTLKFRHIIVVSLTTLLCFVGTLSWASAFNGAGPDILVYDELGKQSLKLKVSMDNKVLSLWLKSEYSLCIPAGTRLELRLKDHTTLQSYSSNGDNCAGILQVSFGGIYKKEDMIDQLGKSEIFSLYFMDESEEHLIQLTKEQSHQIKNQINKLAGTNYKTL